jgi:hypothetical protein
MNTFEAPPRSPRVDLPPPFAPFVPRLPSPPKRQTVATAPPGTVFASLNEAVSELPARPAGMPRGGVPTFTPVRQRTSRRLYRTLRRVATMVVVMAIAAGGVFAYQHFKVDPPPHPSEWDPRLLSLVTFVETERGLNFEHPIFVDFLPVVEYELATAPQGPVDDDTRAAAKYRSDLLDVFGLASGYDALGGDTTMSSSSTLGFYSPTTDRITVRGTELTPPIRVVVAHELTHALQAQHFNLRLGGSDDMARRSIAEADAMRVENAYLATLTPEDQALANAGNTITPEAAAMLATVPWPVVELGYAPYQLGPAFLQSIYLREGNNGVNELFEDPPTERMLLTPWKGLSHDVDAKVSATAPALVKLEQKSQPLTMIQLLVMLDAWLPWTMARGSLDTLAGAAYTTYRYGEGGPLCMTATAQFDGDPRPFADALLWWAGASGSSTTPAVVGNQVTFEACARGGAAPTPPLPVISPSQSVIIENSTVPVGAEVDGVRDVKPFLCTARSLIDNPNIAPLLVKQGLSAGELAMIDAARNDALRTCAA